MKPENLSKQMKYIKIFHDIRDNIISYKLAPETQILGVRELMKYYHASYSTVMKALQRLSDEKYITTVQGKGIFVQSNDYWDRKTDDQNRKAIGLLVTDMNIPFFGRLIRVLEKEASSWGYELIIRNSDFDSELEKKIIENFIRNNVKGAIVVPTFDDLDSDYLETVDGEKLELVYLLRKKRNYNCSYIIPDDYRGVLLTTEHVISNGHRNIAYIAGEDIKGYDFKFKAFSDALLRNGLKIRDDWIRYGKGFEVSCGYDGMKKILDLPEWPTSVVCYTDSIAVGVIRACRDRGLTLPEDMSVVGFNDDGICNLVEPRITTVFNPIEEIGKTGLRTLISRLDSPKDTPDQFVLPVSLVIRDSVMQRQV